MKAIIFDFDGLMLDSESPAFHAWAGIYRDHGVELRLERWVECVGASYARFDPFEHLLELVGRSKGAALDRLQLFAEKERRKIEACSRLPLMPGVEDVMASARARGLKLAVASSSAAEWVKGHLQRLGCLQEFDAIRTRDDVLRVKPFPDLYLAVATALSLPVSQCVVFEDSLNGVRAAKSAGMRCFAVPNFVTSGLDFREADGVLSSLVEADLDAILCSHVTADRS